MPPRTTPAADLIPCIGYIRVSWLQEEQISPDIQRNAITEWARRRGRHIIRWIEDLDVSGRTFHRKIMEGIHSVEAGDAKEIAVWKFSRFGRNRAGCAVNLGRINRAGGELQSATEEVDARTAVGKLTRGMLMEIAAFESDRIGEQWKEAHANRRARGLPPNGRPRFGYILRGRIPDPLNKHRTIHAPNDGPERYEIDPRIGPILAELYRRYTAGDGMRALASWLNDAGIRTMRGNTWSDAVMLEMLDAGFGAGLIRTHDVNCECPQPTECTNMILIPGAHEPVITAGEWQAYRRRRERVARTAPRARVTVYPLTGITRCGHCRSTMTIKSERGIPGYVYMCGGYLRKRLCAARSVRRTALEDVVRAALMEWADDLATKTATIPPDPPRVEVKADDRAIRVEIEKIDEALVELTLQLVKKLVPEAVYEKSRDELLAERAAAENRLAKATALVPLQREEYVPVLRALAEEWPTLAKARRREMLAELVREVRVFRDSRTSARVEVESMWGAVSTAEI